MQTTLPGSYDIGEFLETPKEVAEYLKACIEEADGDASFFSKAL
jgi:DNA-binding phage protein